MGPSGKVKVAAIIGYPLKHSLSPVFQQAAFDFYGLPVHYEAWETPHENLAQTVCRLRDETSVGGNITTPHKEAVMGFLDVVDEGALEIGAVNTIVNRRGALHGYNTDADGFARSLAEAGYVGAEKSAVVLGAGGAARAVGVSLIRAGAFRIAFANRDRSRAQRLVETLSKLDAGCVLSAVGYDRSSIEGVVGESDLIVNATTVGMRHTQLAGETPLPGDLIPPGSLVFDLVYNPPRTRLLAEAEARGAKTINGVSMLIYQGAAAFEFWTGKQAPVGLMFERVLEALERE